jgi:hypothetical protein
MYSRSAKGGDKGDPNRNPWLAKMYNVMLTKKLISFQDLKYPGLRRPDLPQISDKLYYIMLYRVHLEPD